MPNPILPDENKSRFSKIREYYFNFVKFIFLLKYTKGHILGIVGSPLTFFVAKKMASW
jgi:hypothetical protein